MSMASGMKEIKESLAQAESMEALQDFIDTYQSDERSSVKALVGRAEKLKKALEAEIDRTETMKQYEYANEQYGYVCGIDEVGREDAVSNRCSLSPNERSFRGRDQLSFLSGQVAAV